VVEPDAGTLSAAIVAWTGYGRVSWPRHDARALVALFGEEATIELLPRLRELEDDFYTSDARHCAPDAKTMGEMAAADFAARHPELTAAAVKAFAWCYTFDYK